MFVVVGTLILLALTIVSGVLTILIGQAGIVEAFLSSFLIIQVGIFSLFAFVWHFFRSDHTAELVGWPAGNPFQKEVAFANLARGILGVLCIWFRGEFWTATVLSFAIFQFGAAFVHLQDIAKRHNYAPGNAGVFLYVRDILVPITILALLVAHHLG